MLHGIGVELGLRGHRFDYRYEVKWKGFHIIALAFICRYVRYRNHSSTLKICKAKKQANRQGGGIAGYVWRNCTRVHERMKKLNRFGYRVAHRRQSTVGQDEGCHKQNRPPNSRHMVGWFICLWTSRPYLWLSSRGAALKDLILFMLLVSDLHNQ